MNGAENLRYLDRSLSKDLFLHKEEATLGGIHITTWHPDHIRTNAEIASWNITSLSGDPLTASGIEERTGIVSRTVASVEDTVQSMAERVFTPVAEEFGDDILAVEFLTSYPDEKGRVDGKNHAQSLVAKVGLPNLLPNLAGLNDDGATTVEANDFHFACTGGAEVFSHIGKYERFFGSGKAVIVASELYTDKLADPQKGQIDPSHAYTIFGDGAGAMVFQPGKDISVLASKSIQFDEKYKNAIKMPIQYEFVKDPALWLPIPKPIENEDTESSGYFSMDGRAVIMRMQPLGNQIAPFLEESGIDPKDVSLIIPHQASLPVLSKIASVLPVELQEKFYINVRTGNYSGLSIMRALSQAINEDRVAVGDTVVLMGFGAGLYASLQAIKLGEK